MSRINYNDGYLYCTINDNKGDYTGYEDGTELYNDYEDDIIDECNSRGYNSYETNAVLSHYEIAFCN